MTPTPEKAHGLVARTTIPFMSHRVTISSPYGVLVSRIRRAFYRFDDVAHSSSSNADHLLVLRTKGGWHILRNGNLLYPVDSLPHAYRTLWRCVINSCVEARSDLVWLHAAAASRNGRACMLVGDKGAGKSTVIAGLCAEGWKYIADDVVPLDPVLGRVHPFPLVPNRRVPGRKKRRHSADSIGLKRESIHIPEGQLEQKPVPIGSLVFTEFDPDSDPVLERLPSGTAPTELVRRVILADRDHPLDGVFTRLISGDVTCYRLRHRGEPQVARLINDLPMNT